MKHSKNDGTEAASWSPNVRLELKDVEDRMFNSDSESSCNSSSQYDSEDNEYDELARAAANSYHSMKGTVSQAPTLEPPAATKSKHHHKSTLERLSSAISKGKVMHSLGKRVMHALPVRLRKTFERPHRVKQSFFVQQQFLYHEEEDLFSTGTDVTLYKYVLNIPQRIFVIMEHPGSCRMAWFYSVFISLVTLTSVLVYIISTIPEAQHTVTSCLHPACDRTELCPNSQICEPVPPKSFATIELICLIIFTFDYVARLILCTTVDPRLACISPTKMETTTEWRVDSQTRLDEDGYETVAFNDAAESSHDRDPDFKARPIRYFFLAKISILKAWYYMKRIMNIVDLIAIFPFILELSGMASGSTLSIVRVLRLARILRVLKLGKGSKGVQVLLATMVASLPALLILGFFSLIGVTLLGALQFFFEGGSFTVNEEFPNGAFLLTDITRSAQIESKFTSIPMAMYWSIISSTAVGFGDIVPTTYSGRIIAIIAMYGGILVLALPISVIGNNFERIYDQTKGHLSYGVVNAVLELMEDDDDMDIMTEMEGADVYSIRKVLIERRASKLSSVYVIAHICLKDPEAEDINLLLVKVGLRDMISALEYVYDLEFRYAQLLEFARVNTHLTADQEQPRKSTRGKQKLSIGVYKFGENDDGKINWALIEKDEAEFYHREFNQLTVRAQELVRYLRKAPEDTTTGYLINYVKKLKQNLNSEDVPMPEMVDVTKESTAADSRKRDLDLASLRVQNAYKRMQSAMHALEIETQLKFLNSPKKPLSKGNNPKAAGSGNEIVTRTPFADIPSNGTGAINLTPGTKYRNEPSGNTPLPNNAGSPVGVVPPPAPGHTEHRDSRTQAALDQHPWADSQGVDEKYDNNGSADAEPRPGPGPDGGAGATTTPPEAARRGSTEWYESNPDHQPHPDHDA